jgi:hypothetical protein
VSSLLPDDDEVLEDGWSPDLPATDSLVRQAVLANAAWLVDLARTAGRPWHHDHGWAGGNTHPRGMFSNGVVPLRPGLDLTDVVAEATDTLFTAGEPFLVLSAWPTDDLGGAGLRLLGHPPLMARFPHAPATAPETDLTLEWVTSPEALAEAEQVLIEGYPLPELADAGPGCLYPPGMLGGTTRVVVARDGEVPVATAAAVLEHGVTLVEGVAALASARGRRAGAAVAWAASTADPERPAVLLASDEGQPVYERMGYVRIERWTAWLRPPA